MGRDGAIVGKEYKAAWDTKQAGKQSNPIETRPHDDPHRQPEYCPAIAR